MEESDGLATLVQYINVFANASYMPRMAIGNVVPYVVQWVKEDGQLMKQRANNNNFGDGRDERGGRLSLYYGSTFTPADVLEIAIAFAKWPLAGKTSNSKNGLRVVKRFCENYFVFDPIRASSFYAQERRRELVPLRTWAVFLDALFAWDKEEGLKIGGGSGGASSVQKRVRLLQLVEQERLRGCVVVPGEADTEVPTQASLPVHLLRYSPAQLGQVLLCFAEIHLALNGSRDFDIFSRRRRLRPETAKALEVSDTSAPLEEEVSLEDVSDGSASNSSLWDSNSASKQLAGFFALAEQRVVKTIADLRNAKDMVNFLSAFSSFHAGSWELYALLQSKLYPKLRDLDTVLLS
eukprot:g5980.t1